MILSCKSIKRPNICWGSSYTVCEVHCTLYILLFIATDRQAFYKVASSPIWHFFYCGYTQLVSIFPCTLYCRFEIFGLFFNNSKVCQSPSLSLACHNLRLLICIVHHQPWCHSLEQAILPQDHYHLGWAVIYMYILILLFMHTEQFVWWGLFCFLLL